MLCRGAELWRPAFNTHRAQYLPSFLPTPSFSLYTAAGSLIGSTSAWPLFSLTLSVSVCARFFYLPNPFYIPLSPRYTFTFKPLNDLTPRVINHPDQLPRCAGERNRPTRSDFLFSFFFLCQVTWPRTMHIDINGPIMAFIAMLLR